MPTALTWLAYFAVFFLVATAAGAPGAARTDTVAALIGPTFVKERAEPAAMLGPIRTAREAAANPANFATFMDLMGAVQALPLGPPYMPCEAIVRQPALIHALDAFFGSSMDNALTGSDCGEMLPPPPHFATLASDAIAAAMADPHCTGTLRYAGLRSYGEFLIATQVSREGAPRRPDAATARKSAAWRSAHAAEVQAAQSALAAYYVQELHLAGAADAAQRAVPAVVNGAFEVCADD